MALKREPTVEKHYLIDRHGVGLPTVGPFDTYEQTCDWRNQHDLNEEYQQVTREVPDVVSPSQFKHTLYKGANYSVVTGKGSIYDVTVTKRGRGKGRSKAQMVFPLRAVLQQAIDRGPDSYIEA